MWMDGSVMQGVLVQAHCRTWLTIVPWYVVLAQHVFFQSLEFTIYCKFRRIIFPDL